MFDCGGVITHPMSVMLGAIPEGLDLKPLGKAFATVIAHSEPDSPWAQVERGEITLTAFAEILESYAPGFGPVFSDIKSTPVADIWPPPEMTGRIAKIRAAVIATALCTNNIAEYRPIWASRMDLDALFDHVVDSSAVGMRKPEPRIYLHLLGLLGLPAENVIFVDDLAANIEAAAALGFQTLLVGEGDEHFAALDKISREVARGRPFIVTHDGERVAPQ